MGKKLHAEQEPDNAVDKFAMKVVKDNETVDISLVSICEFTRGGKICVEVTGCRDHCKQLCGGMN